MKNKIALSLRISFAFLVGLTILALLVYFVPALRNAVITALQRERGTWEPSARIVTAEYFLQTAPDGSGYMASGKVYVYECAPQTAQIGVNGSRQWVSRAGLKEDVCLPGQP